MNGSLELVVADSVSGDIFISKDIQAMVGKRVEAKSAVVFDSGENGKTARVTVSVNDVTFSLPLSHFKDPPTVNEIMDILPHKVKQMALSRSGKAVKRRRV